jgi:hypothetical protein
LFNKKLGRVLDDNYSSKEVIQNIKYKLQSSRARSQPYKLGATYNSAGLMQQKKTTRLDLSSNKPIAPEDTDKQESTPSSKIHPPLLPLPGTTATQLFHETMRHRNDLMRREAGYKREIGGLRETVKALETRIEELKGDLRGVMGGRDRGESNEGSNRHGGDED